ARWLAAAAATLLVAGPAWAADGKIKEIKDRGSLRVCHAEALPMNYKDPKTGEWTGYNVDAAEHLAAAMGVELEHVDATWATVIPSLQTDKCDVALVGLFRTAERAQVVLFADPWGFDTQSAGVLANSDLKSYEDLDKAGNSVAVLSGTADEAFAQRFFKNAEVKSLVSDKLSTIFLEVASKRATAVFTDTTTLKRFINENSAMKLRPLGDQPVNPQGYSYAIAPGEYQFQQFLNIWMERTETDGTKAAWHKKWFEN
ncbi:MAG: transporter substrate-binding domain-containing protein, partial [Thiotrichales bacterium]|nr:transporter substrate-binding domain-containing protein [Thiotrichales bacterium]